MFGGFGGEDVNSFDGDDAGETGNGAGLGSDPGNESYQNYEEGSNGSDPAQEAAHDAFQGANDINSAGASGRQVAEGIGRTAGLFSAIEGLVGPRQVRLAKSQRVFARAQAQYQLDQAGRAIEQYKADSAIQQQKLSEQYVGRGLESSSIQQEGMKYFSESRERAMAQLAQQQALAQANQRLVKSTIKASYANKWTSFGNSLAALV